MKCPECGTWSEVLETRDSKHFGHTRRRECGNGHRFSTQEVVIPKESMTETRRAHNLINAAKGREVMKAKNDKRKLEVDRLKSEGWSTRQLASKYRLSTASIRRILKEER
jgi:transcriptional regulator NrdR family protein